VTTDFNKQSLRDLGERRILHELVVPRFPAVKDHIIGIGDDCAVIPTLPPGHAFVITTDPCPVPVVCLIETADFYHYGWMTVLINVSDLAAMGASPLALLVSTVMPEDMTVAEYSRFLDGLSDASLKWSCPVVGGNIKDGPSFTATGTALGSVKTEYLMRRAGSSPGDRVCIIGEMGFFWAAVLSRVVENVKLQPSDKEVIDRMFYQPVPRIKEGITLAASQVVTACMDSSDGVSACLYELAQVNQVDIEVKAESLNPDPIVSQIAEAAQVDSRKLMLSWGDWELVCTVPPEHLDQVRSMMKSLGTTCTDIGEVCPGTGKVWLIQRSQKGLLTNLASERFSGTSFFTHGLDAYLNFLRNEPLATGFS
jgi:thiamine-monophosphate kinase